METVRLTINYKSEESDGVQSSQYEMAKTFLFSKLPLISECFILLHNEAITGFTFYPPVYDPKEDVYYVMNTSSEGVKRYYHGDAKVIMDKVISRYKHHGWSITEIK